MWNLSTITHRYICILEWFGANSISVTSSEIKPTFLPKYILKAMLSIGVPFAIISFQYDDETQRYAQTFEDCVTKLIISIQVFATVMNQITLRQGVKDLNYVYNGLHRTPKTCALLEKKLKSFWIANGFIIISLILAAVFYGVCRGILLGSSIWHYLLFVVSLIAFNLSVMVNFGTLLGTTLFCRNNSQLIAALDYWKNRLTHKQAEFDVMEIFCLIQEGFHLVELNKRHHNALGAFLCSHLGWTVVSITTALFSSVVVFFQEFNLENIASSIVFALTGFSFSIILGLYCQSGQALEDMMIKSRQSFENFIEKKRSLMAEKDLFEAQILVNRFNQHKTNKPQGFFEMNNKALISIWHTNVTYLIVLVNFKL